MKTYNTSKIDGLIIHLILSDKIIGSHDCPVLPSQLISPTNKFQCLGAHMTKTIIITGASSGIGKVLALCLAHSGNNIIAVGRNKATLDELRHADPERITPVVADITKSESRLKIKEALLPNACGVYLVNNAGIAVPTLLADLSEEEWDQHYLVNTKAPVFLTKLLLPHLQNGGRVLNISTGLAHNALPGFSAYGVSKAALYMMKEYYNIELYDQDIAFGSAMPGVVDTPIQEHIRSTSVTKFPAVGLFQGFKQRNELLAPATAAKFLAWLLMETDKEQFMNDNWDIYDNSHHQHWSQAGEINPRMNNASK